MAALYNFKNYSPLPVDALFWQKLIEKCKIFKAVSYYRAVFLVSQGLVKKFF
jgi:hypothetical protein